jgi:hypothetical protein
MAALTVGVLVRTVEPEARRQVIECRLSSGQTGKSRGDNDQHCENALHCSAFKSANEDVR